MADILVDFPLPRFKWGKTRFRSHLRSETDIIRYLNQSCKPPDAAVVSNNEDSINILQQHHHQQQEGNIPMLVAIKVEREPSPPKKEEHCPVASESATQSKLEQEEEGKRSSLVFRFKVRPRTTKEEPEPSPPKKKLKASKSKKKKSNKKENKVGIRIPLTKKELEQDLFAIRVGQNAPKISCQRKGKPEFLFPGSNLPRILTADRYRVRSSG